MSIWQLRKDDIIQVAKDMGLTVPADVRFIDLKSLIENSDIYKNQLEVMQKIIDSVTEERQRKAEESKEKLEFERLKLAQLEKQIELENARKDSPQTQSLNPDASNRIDSLIKSIKTLTISVPVKSESFNLFFQSIEKAFKTKKMCQKI
ncbi:hypothetical protein AVEN_117910-1 [Araneus ventricosus]|uniref:Uncharacterized protein n=1 Tax=Araneus ventricosus TaxID=182803 RepID=A0A4Y2J9U5_ARAVE|nr:hypothetical protein AVEN_117910-1 [Araneus ventricosus]